MSSELTAKDLHEIVTKLISAKKKWQPIGRALNLENHDIDGIKGTDLDEKLTNMLSLVLERRSLTWKLLIDILREPLVAQIALANELGELFLYSQYDVSCMAHCYL